MVKRDVVEDMIPLVYFKMLKNAITKHKHLNKVELARKLGISEGNSSFRSFIDPEGTDILGLTSLQSLIETCNYEFQLVPVRRDDLDGITEIAKINKKSYTDISKRLSDLAKEACRTPRVAKEKKVIKNANLINDSLFDLQPGDQEILDQLAQEEEERKNNTDFFVGIKADEDPMDQFQNIDMVIDKSKLNLY